MIYLIYIKAWHTSIQIVKWLFIRVNAKSFLWSMEGHPQSGFPSLNHAAPATLTSLLFLKYPIMPLAQGLCIIEKIHNLLYLEQYFSTPIYLHGSLLLLPQAIDQILPSHEVFPDYLILQIHSHPYPLSMLYCSQ